MFNVFHGMMAILAVAEANHSLWGRGLGQDPEPSFVVFLSIRSLFPYPILTPPPREAAAAVPSCLLALDCLPQLAAAVATAEGAGASGPTVVEGSAPVFEMLIKRSASLIASVNARYVYEQRSVLRADLV